MSTNINLTITKRSELNVTKLSLSKHGSASEVILITKVSHSVGVRVTVSTFDRSPGQGDKGQSLTLDMITELTSTIRLKS